MYKRAHYLVKWWSFSEAVGSVRSDVVNQLSLGVNAYQKLHTVHIEALYNRKPNERICTADTY